MEETIKPGQKIFVKETKNFQRNDIVAFDFYGDDYSEPVDEEPGKFKQHWERRIYRLIAYSGDTLEIKDDEVFINNRKIPFPEKGKLPYVVFAIKDISDLLPEDPDGMQTATMMNGDTFIYNTNITRLLADELRERKTDVIKVIRDTGRDNLTPDSFFARPSSIGKWAVANYGPLFIPKPGETIIVNESNYRLYRNIPGIKTGENIVKEKLYFIMGDNRYMAQDSRYIGLISESNMYGVVK